jgi:methyl-accepting chemotaxis protein
MGKVVMADLSVKRNADASKNATAMTGIFIMNFVLVAAYLLEVLKGARDIVSYGIIAALCIVPCILAAIVFLRKREASSIRYILGIGFSLLYGYIMFTTVSDIPFCYIIVAFVMFLVYVDFKFLVILGTYAFIVNIARVVLTAMQGQLTGDKLTNAEISIACISLTFAFALMAIRKMDKINQANIDKADLGKDQADTLLQTTLDVASSMTENINDAMGETEVLKEAIDATQQEMERLADEVNVSAQAIDIQKQSSEKINAHIQNVEASVYSITDEVTNAEDNLNTGNEVMKALLEQVQISEKSNELVAQKMAGLKECAAKMQDIMSLIGSVANQTGLLSLNASIEAARAGEAGRGFAVVAGEISNLSSQTNSATSEINTLIEDIVASVGEVNEAMDTLLECSRLQNQYVDTTAESFEKIHGSTQSIVEQVANLRSAVEIVMEENKQVEEGIENVANVTQRVMDSANETLASCNTNLQSIAKVSDIMNTLTEEAAKLQ